MNQISWFKNNHTFSFVKGDQVIFFRFSLQLVNRHRLLRKRLIVKPFPSVPIHLTPGNQRPSNRSTHGGPSGFMGWRRCALRSCIGGFWGFACVGLCFFDFFSGCFPFLYIRGWSILGFVCIIRHIPPRPLEMKRALWDKLLKFTWTVPALGHRFIRKFLYDLINFMAFTAFVLIDGHL